MHHHLIDCNKSSRVLGTVKLVPHITYSKIINKLRKHKVGGREDYLVGTLGESGLGVLSPGIIKI